jgi:Uma2 family endonuclease
MGWLVLYIAQTLGVRVGDNATVRLDRDNEPQPDALLRIDVPALGRFHVDEDGYIQGAPELIVEIAASSATYDLREKLNAYRRNGVQEYMVLLVYDQALTWLQLENDTYVPLPVDERGTIHSRIFPGLWLSPQALLAADLATMLATLQQGLESAEHGEFVKCLTDTQSDVTI